MLADKVAAWRPVELGNDVDVLDTVRQMVGVHDEPVATATWLSHFVLTRQVGADGFGALFGGLGGDELNAGEYEYFIFHFADLAEAGRTGELEHEIARWAAHHDHPIYRKDRTTALRRSSGCAILRGPAEFAPTVSASVATCRPCGATSPTCRTGCRRWTIRSRAI